MIKSFIEGCALITSSPLVLSKLVVDVINREGP